MRLQVLGAVRAWHGSAELDLGSARQWGLLGILALADGQYLSRVELMDALWREQSPASAVNDGGQGAGAVRVARLLGQALQVWRRGRRWAAPSWKLIRECAQLSTSIVTL